ncbi:MAG: hypothetical protein JO257_30570 [Deltaproteobacteria bacterium]|nr:hypothetical protein [Deltaproteobacteria bacterium]
MIPLAAVAAIWTIVWTMVILTGAPIVAAAGAFDLTATAGLAMYVLGVRPGQLPKRALTLTVAVGAIAARVLLARVGDATHAVIAAAVTLELAAIVVVVVRFSRARAAWRAASEADDRLETALRATGIPGVVAAAIACELMIVRCAFAGWRRPRGRLYSVHRTGGWGLYAGTFIALTLVETPLVHVALAAFGHTTIAWVATGLSLYSVVWLVGDLHALRHGGVALTPDVLELRLGVRWRARIPRAAIVWAARCEGATCKATDFSILGANVVVRLAEPHEVRGLLGRRRVVRELALSIDEPDAFLAALRRDPLAVAHDGA